MRKMVILLSLIILFLMLGIINLRSNNQRLVNEGAVFEELLDKLNAELDSCQILVNKFLSENPIPKPKVITKEVPKVIREPEIIIEYVDVIRETKCECPECPKHPICLPDNHRLWLGGLSVDTHQRLMGHVGYDWRSEYLFTCGPAIDCHGVLGVHVTVLRRF